VSEQSYWFEEVPEEERYWFLAPWGMSPKRRGEREAQREEIGLSTEDETALRNVEVDMRLAKVFGISEQEAGETRKRHAEIHERMVEAGYGAAALVIPWWSDVQPRLLESNEAERIYAPKLFSTRDQAEEQQRHLEDTEPEAYLELVERFEDEGLINEAFDNTPPLRVLWIDRDTLLDKLEDSEFLCVMVDDTLKLRRDFIQELSQEGGEEGN
jgi:hypothetical protein